jgi:histidine ammonia-lyase
MIEEILNAYRQQVHFIENDATMYDKIHQSITFLQSMEMIFQFE